MATNSTEVGFVFQCVLCGSYAVFALDALDPVEVERKAQGTAAAAGHASQKLLQKDVHAAQEALLEQMQKRVSALAGGGCQEPAAAVAAIVEAAAGQQRRTHRGSRFAMLPCAPCIEISIGRKFAEWLDDDDNLEQPALCTPQTPVVFEFDELPPAYTLRGGKWLLAQGVGPKDLDVRMPNQLPAGQFRTLLPPAASAVRPPCWQKDAAEEVEPADVWSARQALIEAVVECASAFPEDEEEVVTGASVNKKGGKQSAKRGLDARGKSVERAPGVGLDYPWLLELCDSAADWWAEQQKAKGSSQRKQNKGPGAGCTARYISVPLLRAVEEVRPLADVHLQNLTA